MKFLKIILCLSFLGFSGQAFGRDPIFPWPLSSSIRPMDKNDLTGSWVAYQHNTIWFIEILNPLDYSDVVYVQLRSNGIRTHRANGWLHLDRKVFLGTITTESQREYGGMLYRDNEGIKIRVSKGLHGYYDLLLYKNK